MTNPANPKEVASVPRRYFRLSLRGDRSARHWELTENQIDVLIRTSEEGFEAVTGAQRTALSRALRILHAMLQNTIGAEKGEAHPEYTRLHLIADSLDAYARDEGGFSNETREAIANDAQFLRDLAR